MKQKQLCLGSILILSALIALPGLGTLAFSQSTPVQDHDTTFTILSRFDQFLDGHRDIGEQLRKDPSLVNNPDFLKDHPDLQAYLQDHPEVRAEIRENPDAFMRQEKRVDRQERGRGPGDDTTRAQLAGFDRFLDSHQEIAEQLRKNPSLVNDQKFVKDHPALQDYLKDNPGIHKEIQENPNAFMRKENRFDAGEGERGRDHDTAKWQVAGFDRFLDSHKEIAEQLRKNPSLVNDQKFLKDHPALQTYLQNQPSIREEIKENPNAFMRQENRFDRTENRSGEGDRQEMSRDRDRQETDRDRQDVSRDRNRQEMDRDRQDVSRDRDRQETDRGRQDVSRDHDRQDMNRNRQDMSRDQRDTSRDRTASFRQFLGEHRDVAEQLSRNPDLAKDKEFSDRHPEFQDFLKTHPQEKQDLMNDPHGFVKSAQQPPSNPKDQGAKPPMTDPKTNQNH
jgi:hypothetical protein